MKLIVLGGAGDMGSCMVEDCAVSDGVELVTIADRNVEGAKKIAERISGSGKVKAGLDVKMVDANDHLSLVNAMAGYDVAASTLGPFHLFEAKLVRAALDAGVHYVSVCDEWEPAEAVFREFSEAAREKGRIILTGLGASPGLTNVAARFLASQFDRTLSVNIYVYQPLDAGGGEAVFRHMLHIMTGDIAVWRGSQRKMVRACSEERLVEFPHYGKIKLWNMGHSEPVTIPRFIDGLEECSFFMGYGRGAELFVVPAKLGMFAEGKRVNAAIKLMMYAEKKMGANAPSQGALRIDVLGEKNGRRETRMICGTGQMRNATGLSLSIGAQMIAKKELLFTTGGVYAPEAVLDPRMFIQYLNAKGIHAFTDLAMTQLVI